MLAVHNDAQRADMKHNPQAVHATVPPYLEWPACRQQAPEHGRQQLPPPLPAPEPWQARGGRGQLRSRRGSCRNRRSASHRCPRSPPLGSTPASAERPVCRVEDVAAVEELRYICGRPVSAWRRYGRACHGRGRPQQRRTQQCQAAQQQALTRRCTLVGKKGDSWGQRYREQAGLGTQAGPKGRPLLRQAGPC